MQEGGGRILGIRDVDFDDLAEQFNITAEEAREDRNLLLMLLVKQVDRFVRSSRDDTRNP